MVNEPGFKANGALGKQLSKGNYNGSRLLSIAPVVGLHHKGKGDTMNDIMVTRKTIKAVAKKLTHNSQLFGDEVTSVEATLREIVNSAERYGCEISGTVNDMWGNSYIVTAVPSKRRHLWSF